MLALADKNRMPHEMIEERHWNYLNAVLTSSSFEEARTRSRKAVDKLDITILILRHEQKIEGPATKENMQTRLKWLESQAKRAESFARWAETRMKEKSAKRQMDRAEDFKKQAEALRRVIETY